MRIAALACGVVLLAGCVAPPAVDTSPASDRRPAAMSAELDPCSPINITTVIAKRLRVGVTEPFATPYLFDAGPLGIQGYQADVMYALAGEFGLRPNEVVWIEVSPDANPVDAEVDFLLSQVGRRSDLDISPSYGPDAYALAFTPGNPFFACVSEALSELQESERLRFIEESWLPTDG